MDSPGGQRSRVKSQSARYPAANATARSTSVNAKSITVNDIPTPILTKRGWEAIDLAVVFGVEPREVNIPALPMTTGRNATPSPGLSAGRIGFALTPQDIGARVFRLDGATEAGCSPLRAGRRYCKPVLTRRPRNFGCVELGAAANCAKSPVLNAAKPPVGA